MCASHFSLATMATAMLKRGLDTGRGPGQRLGWLLLLDRIKAAHFHQRIWKELESELNKDALEVHGILSPSGAYGLLDLGKVSRPNSRFFVLESRTSRPSVVKECARGQLFATDSLVLWCHSFSLYW